MNIKKLRLIGIVLFFIFLNTTIAYGQFFFRFEAEFSIKSKTKDEEKGSLTLGRVYYDKNTGILVYDIRFPEPEVWVSEDTVTRVYKDNLFSHQMSVNPYVKSTVFHLVLEGSLSDFGLGQSNYSIESTEKEEDMVITTWVPPSNVGVLGNILTSTINNKLYGVVMKSPDDEIMSRQFFRKYTTVKGLSVPTEIVQIMYSENKKIYQMVKLSDIIINNTNNEEMYNYNPGIR
ncbi:MAG: hypothetical protein K9H84_01355 [Bacteroidales bacterium]|nr:hypothetical protein [Bacteroidales bacterium]